MAKNIKLIASIVSLFLVTLVLNYVTSIEESVAPITFFITEDTEVISYQNLNVQNSNGYYDVTKASLAKLLLTSEVELDEKQKETAAKIVKIVDDIHTNVEDIAVLLGENQYETLTDFPVDIKGVFVAKFKSSLASIYLKKYFVKQENGIYRLNDETKADLEKDILEANQVEMSDAEREELSELIDSIDLFVKQQLGRYVFSFNEVYLTNYLGKISEANLENEITKKFTELATEEKMELVIVDTKKIIERYSNLIDFKGYIDNLNYLYSYSTYENGVIDFNMTVNGAGKVFSMIDSSELTDRKLTDYMNEDFNVYFANNSFEKFFREINNEVAKAKGMDYSFFVGMMIGRDPFEMIDNLGDEIVININDQSIGAVLNTKDPSMLSDLFSQMGLPEQNGVYQVQALTLELNDNKIFINQEVKSEINNIDFANLSLYSKMDIDYMVNNFDQLADLRNLGIEFFTPELFIYGKKDQIRINISVDYEEVMNYIVTTGKSVAAF